jgi:aminopeptidase N
VFRFEHVAERPEPSLGRGFSAPVVIEYDYSDADLIHLLGYDSDPLNRWEAGQRLAMKLLLDAIAAGRSGRHAPFPTAFAEAFGRVLADAPRDPAFAAEVLALPAEVYIGEHLDVIDPDAIHDARQGLRRHLAGHLHQELRQAYDTFAVSGAYSPDAASAGRRALRNLSLSYLMERGDAETRALCVSQLQHADNMTDALAALTALANCDCAERVPALAAFYDRWQAEPLVVDKWFSVQAGSRLPVTLASVQQLAAHPAFELTNPNKVYALISAFGGNQVNFHAADGRGYTFMATQVAALDPINPQVAARMARYFERWKRFDIGRQRLMQAALEQLRALPALSRETAEVVVKALS